MKNFEVRLTVSVTTKIAASNQEEADEMARRLAKKLEWATSSLAGRTVDVGDVVLTGVSPVLE